MLGSSTATTQQNRPSHTTRVRGVVPSAHASSLLAQDMAATVVVTLRRVELVPSPRSGLCCSAGGDWVAQAEATDALLGRVIAEAYVIQELVGIGGMGRVYRAEQRALGRMVAVKVVHRHLLGDRDSVARFYTEARAASSLNHPNSVSVFDFGRTDDGILYLVMEHLRGKDLARIMHEEGQLHFGRIIDFACGILGALGEAHE